MTRATALLLTLASLAVAATWYAAGGHYAKPEAPAPSTTYHWTCEPPHCSAAGSPTTGNRTVILTGGNPCPVGGSIGGTVTIKAGPRDDPKPGHYMFRPGARRLTAGHDGPVIAPLLDLTGWAISLDDGRTWKAQSPTRLRADHAVDFEIVPVRAVVPEAQTVTAAVSK